MITGSGEQYASALQVPRHVGLVRTKDLLESRAGLPNSGQDAQGPLQECRSSVAEQSGQRDAAVAESRESTASAVGSPEAEEASRQRQVAQ